MTEPEKAKTLGETINQARHRAGLSLRNLAPKIPVHFVYLSEAELPAGVELRNWQRKALRRMAATNKPDFLLVAVPAAGKTLFALLVAWLFLRERKIQRVVVVCPTNHLRYQWAENAHRIELNLDPEFSNADGRESPDYQGIVVTYQQVAALRDLFRANCREQTLVVFDEIDHAGDELTWGKALRQAFEPAAFRLGLSGTPFRSDANPIPFIEYADNRCQPDFVYDYGNALADGVVRPVYFPTIENTAVWLGADGKFKQRSLLDKVSEREASERWRTILDPDGDWLRGVIKQADENLLEMRRSGHPEAAGLIVALDSLHAAALVKRVEAVTGTKPALAIHDKPDAGETIKRFVTSGERWIVAVRMVSEGVDMPRLRVCVYATNVCSELFFIQLIGRLLRKQPGVEEQSAALYIPYIAALIRYAEQIKEVREHVLRQPARTEFFDRDVGETRTPADNYGAAGGKRPHKLFLPISSESKTHHTIFDGEQFTREELVQAERINLELGLSIPSVMSAKLLRCGMALGAGEIVQASRDKKLLLPGDPELGGQAQNGRIRSDAVGNNNHNVGNRAENKVLSQAFDLHHPAQDHPAQNGLANSDSAIPLFIRQKTLRRQAQRLAGQLSFALDIEVGAVHQKWIKNGGSSQSKATVEELQQKIQWLAVQLTEANRQ